MSYPHPGYQRPVDDVHVGEISMFITSGSNSFSPEVVLAYTAKYDYYKEGAVSGIDAIADIRNGNGFTSNIDGISFKKIRKVNNGYLYEISIPYEKKLIDEEKPFRRVDGNHRLQAMEVSAGDIVISQRGSLGQCAIVDDTFPKLNISANIIAIKNPKGISAEFIRNLYIFFPKEYASTSPVAFAYAFIPRITKQSA